MKYRVLILRYQLAIFLHKLLGSEPYEYAWYHLAIFVIRRERTINKLHMLETMALALKEKCHDEPEKLERIEKVLNNIKKVRATIL